MCWGSEDLVLFPLRQETVVNPDYHLDFRQWNLGLLLLLRPERQKRWDLKTHLHLDHSDLEGSALTFLPLSCSELQSRRGVEEPPKIQVRVLLESQEVELVTEQDSDFWLELEGGHSPRGPREYRCSKEDPLTRYRRV